jgi:hypothetical protein
MNAGGVGDDIEIYGIRLLCVNSQVLNEHQQLNTNNINN